MRPEPDASAHAHDLIVIGGSAGAVEAVSEIVAALSATFPAAVCVVLHQAPYQPSRLAEILDRLGPLRAVRARAGAPLRRGTIHVAIPDHHLLVERAEGGAADAFGVLRLTHGPKETRARPAVDVLFHSAALAFGPRVIGVVLSGALDDGTAGLWAIRDRGGLAVVQDPEDATVASMPANALAEVGADHVARAREIARLLVELSRRPVEPATPAAGSGPAGEPTAQLAREVRVAAIDEATHPRTDRDGVPSRFACPECGGVLWEVSAGRGPTRFRCESGHAYSPASLAEGQTEAVEEAMWAALRALEDRAELARTRGRSAAARGLHALAARFATQADAAQVQGAAIRDVLRLDGPHAVRPEVAVALPDEPSPGGDRPRDPAPADERTSAA